MPRLAEKIAGTLAPKLEAKRHSDTMVHSLYGNRKLSTASGLYGPRYPSSVISVRPTQSISVTSDPDDHEGPDADLLAVIQEANMDGVRHLRAQNTTTRNIWLSVIVLFVLLALYQIYSQCVLYFKHPVATNIEAEYPSTIPFPVVAVCNNNQFRLTYITGAKIMNRRPKGNIKDLKTRIETNSSIFNTIIEKTWDMDAVKFLRFAAHGKSRMILDCTWPDGTKCSAKDFKPVWTATGLCWAINSDPSHAISVTGSGINHGLQLLLNVESYERIDACTPYFRSKSLSGIKILIYNQTHVPESSLDGINVPSGYSTGIPIRIQHRTKLPGVNCIQEADEHLAARGEFDSNKNIRTCTIRRYLDEIERTCNCSMRRLFHNNITKYAACLVDDYFSCVQDVIRIVQKQGTNAECPPPCQVMDYMAWQDMNRMPTNIMPAVIEEAEEEDEYEVHQEDIDDDVKYVEQKPKEKDETYFCKDEDEYLTEKQVAEIKRDAHRAYEKQSRYQDDIFLRTKRLISRLQEVIKDLMSLKWGWRAGELKGIYERLTADAKCFISVGERHEEISTIMRSRPPQSEERRAGQVHFLVDSDSHARNPHRFKTIGDVKATYGDRVEDVLHELEAILLTIEKMWHLYEEKTYTPKLTADLRRMDRILSLMSDYENNRLQRRAWAEKMNTRQMRHFFEEEFYEGYYQVIMKDLDQTLRKSIMEVEKDDWPKLKKYLTNGTVYKTGAILFFETSTEENQEKFKKFLMDMHNCTMTEVKRVATKELNSFKTAFRQLQAAYMNIFKKDLPDFLENFEFGSKFVSDNFAMVNVHFHQMYIERWSQDRTYTFWSLACDIGGALGLFLGASLLTIIELVYLFFQYGYCGDLTEKLSWCDPSGILCIRSKKPEKKENKQNGGYTPSEMTTSMLDKSSRVHHEPLYPKKNVWGRSPRPHQAIDIQPENIVPLIDEMEVVDDDDEHHPPPPYRHSQDLSDDELLASLQTSQHSMLSPPDIRDRLSEITEENSNMDSEGRLKPSGKTQMNSEEEDSAPPSSSMDLVPPLFSHVPEKSTTL